MDKNIFIKKYNPDIKEKFSSRSKEKTINIDYKKDIWKGITGNHFNIDIKSADDLKIQFEKPNLNEITSKLQSEYSSRQKENEQIEKKNKKIKNAALQSLMKIELDLGLTPNVSNNKTHEELKQIQIHDNDILREEKEKFNDLLKNLESII
jgi:hypothetical protein